MICAVDNCETMASIFTLMGAVLNPPPPPTAVTNCGLYAPHLSSLEIHFVFIVHICQSGLCCVTLQVI